MKWKPVVLSLLLFFLIGSTHSQHLSQTIFELSGLYGGISTIDISVDNVILTMDGRGKIISFDVLEGGEYDYFFNDVFGNRNGKIKSIGGVEIDYFTNDIFGNRTGKLMSIGDLKIDYWTNDIMGDREGKLKSIGDVGIDYWTNDIIGNRDGKLKSIGDIKIDYFTNDIFNIREGKVKSIGDITISYWTNDLNGRNGLIRSIEGHSPEVFVTIQ
ncbi:hypothetical protein [Pleomorphovibrio marinus]|uniref:hypothetical protein n=1 Tax=Pleomorphovibrio marinus TaxID=2164132 RepID=UPI000E0C8F7A|nr:hypothetical protein [Pleomorphovibrio marinus]